MTQQARKALSGVTMKPFWLDRPDAPDTRFPLETATQCDLLIVGGGFTGLWAGIQAKEQNPDLDVVLIEAGRVAHGASGRPGGVVSTSVMHGLSNAARIFPKDIDELERLGHENMHGFLDTITRHGIDCHAEWGGELTVAVDPDHVPALSDEHRLHLEHGHDSMLLDTDGVRAQINSPRYFGGIWSKNISGTVHPALLAWGLKRAALELGVRLYENTRLTRVIDNGTTLTVETSIGARIKAPKVLLATNAFAEGDRRIKRRVVAVRDRVLATEPLSDAQMQSIGWQNRQGVYDTRTQMNYMRLTKDNRIIFGGRLAYAYGGEISPSVDHKLDTYEPLAGAFFSTFPQLDGLRFSHAWSGPIDLTTRMAVHFQRYHGGKAVYAGGYSGFGVSASRFGARIGLDILNGSRQPESHLEFATSMPTVVPPEPFRWLGAEITMYALDTADEKGGWRRPWLNMVTKLGFPLS